MSADNAVYARFTAKEAVSDTKHGKQLRCQTVRGPSAKAFYA